MNQTPGPPFTITVAAADSLAKTVEAVTRLDLGTDFRLDIRLHRQNRVRSIYSSLAIEGNRLSLAEVADVLGGHAVRGRPADIQEVKNAREAYDQLLRFDPYSTDDFLVAHRLLTQGLLSESGTFRGGDVAVYDEDIPVHVGARPEFVPALVADLFAWARDVDLHPVLLSAIVHCEIETIHPFADGNGRIGRLWQTLMLAHWNEVFVSLPMESVIFQNRPQYYQALRTSQHDNDVTVFIEFSLRTVLAAIEDVLTIYDTGGQGDVANDAQRVVVNGHEQLLAVLRSAPTLSAAAIADQIGKSPRTVQRHLRALKESGRLRREGPDKTGRWIVIDEGEQE